MGNLDTVNRGYVKAAQTALKWEPKYLTCNSLEKNMKTHVA